MKALFNLKEEPKYISINMTNKQAEKAYKESYKYPNVVTKGLLSDKLSFIEWVLLYNIKII